nr:efflux RND transporter permease subunit [Deinobacterium chartae]
MRDLRERLFDHVNPLVGFSVTRYVLSIGIFIGVVIFGLIATTSLGVDLLPTTNTPVVSVNTSFPGASPEVVDRQVTRVIEGAVADIPGVVSIGANSRTGGSSVFITFTPDTNQDSAANKVASQVSAVTRQLPTGASAPSVRTFDPNSQPILEFGISGGSAPLEEVHEYAENVLVPAVQRVEGVANVEVNGGPERQYQVLLDPSRLQAYGLNPQQISSAISSASVDQPIGSITRGADTLSFSTRDVPRSLEDIGEIVVDGNRGVRVADLGTVKDASSTDSFTRINGTPVVLISIQQASGSNAVAVADGVRELMKHFSLPQGYAVSFSNDTTGPIRASIKSTTHEIWVTAGVVAVVVLLFLGRINTAFTVILAIPISLAAAPVLYQLLGFTFNQVSLLAMIVAIGIVVDDSIVVAENVERYQQMGVPRHQAVLRGASEVFGAVAAASLSLLAVLIPVSFIGGFAGRYLQQFALGLSAAVLFSWLEALLFLTVRMAYTPEAAPVTWRDLPRVLTTLPATLRWGFAALRQPWAVLLLVGAAAALWRFVTPLAALGALALPLALGVGRYLWDVALGLLEALTLTLHGITERGMTFVREGYARALGGMLRFSPLVLVGAAVFLAATLLFVVPKVPFNFVPQSDSGTFNVRIRPPNGTSLNGSNVLSDRAERFLLAQPEVETVQANVNSGGSGLNVKLVERSEREGIFQLIPRYQMALNALYADQPSTRVMIFAGGGFRGQGSGLSFNLISPSYELLTERANRAVEILEANPNVLSASSDISSTTLQNNFVPDASRLAGTGISSQTIAQTLQTYASGANAGNVEVQGFNYPIQVKMDPAQLQDMQTLLSLPVYSPSLQTSLAVGQLGSIVQSQSPTTIGRTNRLYGASLSVNLGENAPTPLEFQREIEQQFREAGILDNQVSLDSGGQFSQGALASQLSSLGVQAFGLALLLVYLVMGAQFNSFRYPVYLLLPVPFAVAGAMWFVWLRGSALDIFAVMGFLLLIGLSAKNAIIYLEFVVDRMKLMPFRDALIEASRLRFRPIVMTTLTVLVISFPLVLGTAEGSEFGRGLGITIMGGVLVSAIMTFFVVPAAFYLFERGRASQLLLPEAEENEKLVPA